MAQRYWVGGNGTWNSTNTSNWSTSSGGSGGASVPGVGDIAVFDTAGTHAITVASTAPACDQVSITVNYAFTLSGNVDLGSASWLQSWGSLDLAGYNFTLATYFSGGFFSNTVSLAFNGGRVILSAEDSNWTTDFNWTYTGTFAVDLTSTSGTFQRVISNKATSWNESTALSIGHSGTDINVTAGASDTLSLGGICKNILLASHTGTLDKSNQKLTVYGNIELNSASGISGTGSTALSFEATTGTQTVTTNGAPIYCPIAVATPGATVRFVGATTVYDTFTFSNGTVELTSSQTMTVASFTTTGTTLKYLQATTSGSRATLSDSSGTNTVTYLSIKDNAATGGATWNATSATNVNAGNATGWNFGAPANTFFLL